MTPDEIANARYLLVKRGLYYAPGAKGYTGIASRAGRFPASMASERDGIRAIHEDDAPDYAPSCPYVVMADDLALRLAAEREEREKAEAERADIAVALDEAIAAERERAEAYRLELATRDAGIAAVLKADGVDYTDELSAWMQLAAAYRGEREAREKADTHVEVLQAKIDGSRSCACAYDNADDVCAHHSPMLVAALARAEKAEAERDEALTKLEKAEAEARGWQDATELLSVANAEIRDTALEEAAAVADQWTQPGTPADPCWLAIGDELGKVRDAILARKEPSP